LESIKVATILSVPYCPCHIFVRAILSVSFCPIAYHVVRSPCNVTVALREGECREGCDMDSMQTSGPEQCSPKEGKLAWRRPEQFNFLSRPWERKSFPKLIPHQTEGGV